MDIAGHRDTCHQFVEPSPQSRDVGSEVEVALAQYGVQLQLLLFAHRLFSSLSTGCARAPCRALHYAAERLCVPQGKCRARAALSDLDADESKGCWPHRRYRRTRENPWGTAGLGQSSSGCDPTNDFQTT